MHKKVVKFKYVIKKIIKHIILCSAIYYAKKLNVIKFFAQNSFQFLNIINKKCQRTTMRKIKK